MGEFSNGDRVSYCGEGVYLVVGPDPCEKHRGRTVVVTAVPAQEPDESDLRSYRTDALDLIPDTISVTVELPRREAEAMAADVNNGSHHPDAYAEDGQYRSAAFRRLAFAAESALR